MVIADPAITHTTSFFRFPEKAMAVNNALKPNIPKYTFSKGCPIVKDTPAPSKDAKSP